jgi:CheY-like chemotaxis protein
VLQQRSYDMTTAADGFEALKIADAEGPFDLLVTDLSMPGMSGDELARRLREGNPTIKILYLTGYSDRLFEKRTLLSEGEAFVDKPVTVQGLLEAVSLLLVGHIPPPRAVRTSVPGACVRLPTEVAELVSLSSTGALVHSRTEAPVGATWPLVIELPLEAISVTGRVVSCRCVDSRDERDGLTRHAVALAFVAPKADAVRALQRVCRTDSAPVPKTEEPAPSSNLL